MIFRAREAWPWADRYVLPSRLSQGTCPSLLWNVKGMAVLNVWKSHLCCLSVPEVHQTFRSLSGNITLAAKSGLGLQLCVLWDGCGWLERNASGDRSLNSLVLTVSLGAGSVPRAPPAVCGISSSFSQSSHHLWITHLFLKPPGTLEQEKMGKVDWQDSFVCKLNRTERVSLSS